VAGVDGVKDGAAAEDAEKVFDRGRLRLAISSSVRGRQRTGGVAGALRLAGRLTAGFSKEVSHAMCRLKIDMAEQMVPLEEGRVVTDVGCRNEQDVLSMMSGLALTVFQPLERGLIALYGCSRSFRALPLISRQRNS